MIRRHQRLRVHIAAYVASLMIPPTHPPVSVPALASGNQIDGGLYKGFFRSLLNLLLRNLEQISKKAKRIGDSQRVYFQFAIRALLLPDSDTYCDLSRCWLKGQEDFEMMY